MCISDTHHFVRDSRVLESQVLEKPIYILYAPFGKNNFSSYLYTLSHEVMLVLLRPVQDVFRQCTSLSWSFCEVHTYVHSPFRPSPICPHSPSVCRWRGWTFPVSLPLLRSVEKMEFKTQDMFPWWYCDHPVSPPRRRSNSSHRFV